MKTIQQRLQAALEAEGETFVKTTSAYIVMTRKAGGYYFLGSAGALRTGLKVSATRSLTDSPRYKNLLAGKIRPMLEL